MIPQQGKADFMAQDTRLTHEHSLGLLKDLFEKLAKEEGKLWHNAAKRFLLALNTEFYKLNIGQLGTSQLLLESFHQAGFSISPHEGIATEGMRASNPRCIFGATEYLRMLSVRAMDLEATPTCDSVSNFGCRSGCVATSWEAACRLLMEVEANETGGCGWNSRKRLLNFAPTPIVWTFVGGDNDKRTSFVTNSEQNQPMLVALVSSGSNLGLKGIVEAEYAYQRLGRAPGLILPSDVFVFSIDTDD